MERLVPSSGGYGALGSMEGNADGGLQVDSPEGNPPAHLPQGRPELQSASRGGAELVSGQPSGLGRSLGSESAPHTSRESTHSPREHGNLSKAERRRIWGRKEQRDGQATLLILERSGRLPAL